MKVRNLQGSFYQIKTKNMRLCKSEKKISEEQKDFIFYLYNSGKNCTEISKNPDVNVSYLLVRKVLKSVL